MTSGALISGPRNRPDAIGNNGQADLQRRHAPAFLLVQPEQQIEAGGEEEQRRHQHATAEAGDPKQRANPPAACRRPGSAAPRTRRTPRSAIGTQARATNTQAGQPCSRPSDNGTTMAAKCQGDQRGAAEIEADLAAAAGLRHQPASPAPASTRRPAASAGRSSASPGRPGSTGSARRR